MATVTIANDLGLDRLLASAYLVLLAVQEIVELKDDPACTYAREIAAAGERLSDRGLQRLGVGSELAAAARSGDAAGVQRLRAVYDALSTTLYPDFGITALLAIFDASEGNFQRARDGLAGERLTDAEAIYRDTILEAIEIASGDRDENWRPFSEQRAEAASSTTIAQRMIETARLYQTLLLWVRDRPAQARKMLPACETTGLRGEFVRDVVAEIIRLPHPVPSEQAVRTICDRLADADCGAIGRFIVRVATRDKADVELSRAEIELLKAFAADGGRSVDVARALNKSPHTVRNQMRSTLAKLGCVSRNEAIVYARRRGWL
jgi:DNA-binding CsgD family transcriptional regulator